MKTALDIELQKVAAATTLCHLCSLERLEKWVVEARKLPQEKSRSRPKRDVAAGD